MIVLLQNWFADFLETQAIYLGQVRIITPKVRQNEGGYGVRGVKVTDLILVAFCTVYILLATQSSISSFSELTKINCKPIRNRKYIFHEVDSCSILSAYTFFAGKLSCLQSRLQSSITLRSLGKQVQSKKKTIIFIAIVTNVKAACMITNLILIIVLSMSPNTTMNDKR